LFTEPESDTVTSVPRDDTPADTPGDTPADAPAGTSADSAAWEPVAGIGAPADEFELDDLDLLGELTHPTRSAVLRRMKDPRTVADVAAEMGVPVTRLYHHVNKLEQAGLIRVVATRQVAAVTERRYQVVARSFRVSPPFLHSADDRELAVAFGALFDVAKLSLQRLLENGGASEIADDNALLTLSEFSIDPARRRELIERMHDLIHEFGGRDSDATDAERITFFAAVFREST
jgi:AcrR family transcriptional regulator